MLTLLLSVLAGVGLADLFGLAAIPAGTYAVILLTAASAAVLALVTSAIEVTMKQRAAKKMAAQLADQLKKSGIDARTNDHPGLYL